MNDTQFPLTLIPDHLRNKVKFKKYNRDDCISSGAQNKIFFLNSGTAYILAYEDNEEIIYPYLFSKDEFIGGNVFLPSHLKNWEILAYSDIVEGYEIPRNLFKTYILPTPIFLESYMEKSIEVLALGAKAFCVRSSGGTIPYFALVLDYVFNKFSVLPFDRYSNFTKLLSVSTASLYNITNKFLEDGVIKKEKNHLYLLDRKKLKQYYNSV